MVDSYFTHFHDTTEHFARTFDRVGRQMAFRGKTRDEALAWQEQFRAKLSDLVGMREFVARLSAWIRFPS